VPLLIRAPGLTSGTVTPALGCTIDLAQTVLHLAGLEPYNGIQGHSLVPLLTDPTASVREHVLIEDDGQRTLKGTDRTVRLRTLVTPTWRLTYYDGFNFGELYHLTDDPLEHHNLWQEPAAQSTRTALSEQLLRTIIDQQDRSPLPAYLA
jgi:arylsulfatase A-like enzyme